MLVTPIRSQARAPTLAVRLAGSDLVDQPSFVVDQRGPAEPDVDPDRAAGQPLRRCGELRRPRGVDGDERQRDRLPDRCDRLRERFFPSAGLVARATAARGHHGERDGQGGAPRISACRAATTSPCERRSHRRS